MSFFVCVRQFLTGETLCPDEDTEIGAQIASGEKSGWGLTDARNFIYCFVKFSFYWILCSYMCGCSVSPSQGFRNLNRGSCILVSDPCPLVKSCVGRVEEKFTRESKHDYFLCTLQRSPQRIICLNLTSTVLPSILVSFSSLEYFPSFLPGIQDSLCQ